MEDYPLTVMDLEKQFSTEEACRAYLFRLRWPNGFVCPRCQTPGGWSGSRKRLICQNCRYQASVTAGTIFQDTHKPLTLWFRAVWHIVSRKNGASAMSLQQELGLGSYMTAWTWLHKLRRAMVRPGRDRLNGTVEVDETYWGAEEEGMIGRQTERKALIIVAVECPDKKIGRIRMRRIPDASRDSLHGFIKEAIESGSTVRTDGWNAYLSMNGYVHDQQIQQHQTEGEHLLPHVHQVVSLLKRWLLGTHQGAIGHDYLDYYLDEFTFRFNRRTSKSRGKLFYRLLQQVVQVDPAPYHSIIGGKNDTNPQNSGGVN
jgi:transposase-like protein